MEQKLIYMDHAATTRLAPEALQAMLPFLTDEFGNASSVYMIGQHAKRAVEDARRTAAEFLNAAPAEIYFTSGGSESDNWALIGIAEAYQTKGRHIITSKIEHHAVLNTCAYLEKRGWEITYLDADENGFISPKKLEAAIRQDTVLVSIMTANNEVGSIQPVRALGEIAHAHGALFHTDAVQAFGHIPIDVQADGIDLLSASAHKLNGPKGVGLLYIKKGVIIGPLIHGGQQERGRRAGTENTAGITGFAEAIRLAQVNMAQHIKEESKLRDYMLNRILREIPGAVLNGVNPLGHEMNHNAAAASLRRLPNNINIRISGIDAEPLLLLLAGQGICASTGSACASGSLDPSHVLAAMGLSAEAAGESLRLTLGAENTREEADAVVSALKDAAARLREMKKRRTGGAV